MLQPTTPCILEKNDIFWNEWKLNPNSTSHNISLAYELRGPLKKEKLIAAVSSLINTHDVLNIFFLEKKEGLHVHRRSPTTKCVTVIDLSKDEITNCNHALHAKINALRQCSFDLRQGPLYKATLIQLSNTHYFFVLCFHHIIVDGLSEKYIINFISDYYNKTDAWHKAFPLSLAAYVDFKRSLFQITHKPESAHFWEQAVTDIDLDGNQLDTIQSTHAHRKKTGKYNYFSIDNGTVTVINDCVKNHHTSPFCVLMSAYIVTLHRLSGFCRN